jgi:hypothetical protein
LSDGYRSTSSSPASKVTENTANQALNGESLSMGKLPSYKAQPLAPAEYTPLNQGVLRCQQVNQGPPCREESFDTTTSYSWKQRSAELAIGFDKAWSYQETTFMRKTPMDHFEAADLSTLPYHPRQAQSPLTSEHDGSILAWVFDSRTSTVVTPLQTSFMQTEAGSADDFRLAQEVHGNALYPSCSHHNIWSSYNMAYDLEDVGSQFVGCPSVGMYESEPTPGFM